MSAPRELCPASRAAFRQVGWVVALVLVVDQATKTAAHQLAPPGAGGWLQPVHNPDALLSLYTGTPAFLVAIGLAALIGFSAHLLHLTRARILPWWAAGLLAGGAASNLADRLVEGAVRDWLALPWMVANLADLAVAAGAVCYLAAGARWAVTEWAAPTGTAAR